jgi:hypothetical protein
MKKLVMLFVISALLFTGCSSPDRTSAQAAAKNQVQTEEPQGTAADTRIDADSGAAASGTIGGDASTGAELYPAYTDIDSIKKWGYIDRKGDFVIEPQFDYANAFMENGLAVIRKNSLEGVIDKKGNFILMPEYELINAIYEDVIVASGKKGSSLLFSLEGDKLFETDNGVGCFNEGLAPFIMPPKKDEVYRHMGYMDKNGKTVIEPVFEEAFDFDGGKALVKMHNGCCALIDRTGKVVKKFDFKFTGGLSEGILSYSNTGEKYGYMTLDGDKLTDEKFFMCSGFGDGLAVVDISNDFSEPMHGLLDKSGKYVLEPKYSSITSLGQGRFAVAEGEQSPDGMVMFSKMAIFTDKGERITDNYYEISPYIHGISFVSTDTQTLIIGLDGRLIEKFPAIDGNGMVSDDGELIRMDIDDDLLYMTTDGQIVWKSERAFNLKNGAVIRQNNYRVDRGIMVHYPVVSNHPDRIVQEKLNKAFKEIFTGEEPVKKTGVFSEGRYEFSSEYSLSQVSNLLVLKKNSKGRDGSQDQWYDFSVYNVNSINGNKYTLKDLFKSGSDYVGRITGFINGKIKESREGKGSLYSVDKVENISPEHGFIITDKALQIYYQAYEITDRNVPAIFDIGYDEIMELINTEGELWKTIESGL